jgi:hypothetical protein
MFADFAVRRQFGRGIRLGVTSAQAVQPLNSGDDVIAF